MDLRAVLAEASKEPVSLAGLMRLWRHTEIIVGCDCPDELSNASNLPDLVRRALGRELAHGASAESVAEPPRPCSWKPPCAYDVLFNEQGPSNGAVARPFVIDVKFDGGRAAVCLVLFGLAGTWATVVADALVRALRGGLARGGALTLFPRHCSIQEHGWPAAPMVGSYAELSFATPWRPGRRDDRDDTANERSVGRPGRARNMPDNKSLLIDLCRRPAALSAWCGVRLDDPELANARGNPTLVAPAGEAHFVPAHIRRKNSKGRTIAFDGWLGSAMLRGELAPWLPLLSFGAVTHIGRNTAMSGLGRYALKLT